MRGAKHSLLALAAGGLAAFSMPPFDVWPVLFVSLPLLVWISEADRGWRSSFFAGWLFGLGYFGVCFYWVGVAFLVDAATYLWMMPFMVGALAGGMAVYWGLAVLASSRVVRIGYSGYFALPIALAIAEWLRGHLFTGFPWTAPGLAAIGMGGLAQLASLIGMPGLTFLICLWACLPAMLGERRVSRPAWACAAGFILILAAGWAYGGWRLAQPDPPANDAVRLRIVQPDIPQDAKWRAGNAGAIFDSLANLSQTVTAAAPRGISDFTHVIWPESAVPIYLAENEAALERIDDLLPDGTTLITGALRRDPVKVDTEGRPEVYNSILGFGSDANVVAVYDKWRLVPGGEFLPFGSILEPLGFRKVVTVPGSFAAGNGPKTVDLPGAPPAGMLICYEAIFPDRLINESRRPQWLINVTNDGWFGKSTGPYQHLAQARMRAIEQGLPLVRAANTGVSAIIDAKGRVLTKIELGQRGVLDSALPAALPSTPYSRYGDWLLLALLATIGGCMLLLRGPLNPDFCVERRRRV
ncbi:MAG: apolipoprotein N-acyltransferase [Hyphomicrobiales bacterium]